MKTNTSLVLQHVLWRGLYFFSVLLLNISIARFFAAEKSGHIFYIVNNLSLILLLAGFCLETGAAYYVASGAAPVYPVARVCLLWAIIASGLSFAVWYAVLHFSASTDLRHVQFLPAGYLFILGVLLTTWCSALFYAKKNFALPNKILFWINILLLVLLATRRNNGFVRSYFINIYFSFFFLQGISLVLFFFSRYKEEGKSRWPSADLLKKLIRYSGAALLANGIYFLVNRIDYWFVGYYGAGTDLGNYIQASKLAQMLFILPSILSSTLFPIFSGGQTRENIRRLATGMRTLLWINITVCGVIALFGWAAFPRIFGPSFGKMYLLFLGLIPGILAVTINYPLTSWYSSRKKISVNIIGGLLALLVICIGDLLLLPSLGVQAAPWVSSAGYITYFAFTVILFRKERQIPLGDFLWIRFDDWTQIRKNIRAALQGNSSTSGIQNGLP